MLSEIYADLDNHPIFPSDGAKTEIKKALKRIYPYTQIRRQSIKFR